MALQAEKSVRWEAEQLGHADPPLTFRVYAHAMPQEETDLSFAEYGPTESSKHFCTYPGIGVVSAR